MAAQLPIIFVMGCPASGKGTLCSLLASKLPIAHLSIGDLLRKINSEDTHPQAAAISTALQKQELLDVEILFPILKDELARLANAEPGMEKKAVLIDGFPRNRSQFSEFIMKFSKPLFVVWFYCPKEIAKQRYLSRRLKGRETDDEAMFEKRFVDYDNEISGFYHEPLLLAFHPGESHLVDTGGETQESYDRLMEKLNGDARWIKLFS